MFEGLFQPMHLLVIFFIALLVFGPRKLPELGKGLGEGIRALKDGMKDNPPAQASSDQSKNTETKKRASPTPWPRGTPGSISASSSLFHYCPQQPWAPE